MVVGPVDGKAAQPASASPAATTLPKVPIRIPKQPITARRFAEPSLTTHSGLERKQFRVEILENIADSQQD
jgi:hypothetical protein